LKELFKKFIQDRRAMTKGGQKILAILLVGLFVVGGLFAYGQGYFTPNSTPSNNDWWNNNQNPPATTAPSGSVYSGPIYMSITDAVTGGRFTTATVQINQLAADSQGRFDAKSTAKLSLAQSANPQSESMIWTEGQKALVTVTCTGNPASGLDYYPVTYFMTFSQGAHIYALPYKAALTEVSQTGGSHQYDVNIGQAIDTGLTMQKITVSLATYWAPSGDLSIWPREQASGVDISLSHGISTTLASVTDASTWVDTGAEITANCTLTSAASDKLVFGVQYGDASLGWGKHFISFDTAGKVQEYGAIVVISTTCTSMACPAGWEVLNRVGLTNEVAFYKVVEPAFPASGSTSSWTEDIPMNVAADATQYVMRAWLLDAQNLNTVATLGTTTTAAPQMSGIYIDSTTDLGIGAIVQNVAMTLSSGNSATPQLEAYFTTPS
jgi:hypothetical protein